MKTFGRILWVFLLLPLFLGANHAISNNLHNERIVVAGGSLTEIIYELGEEKAIVGVDDTSQYPAQAREIPSVGYYRSLNVEGVVSVSPTQLILLQGSGPKNVIVQLEALGINTIHINNPKTVDGLLHTIEQVATAVNKDEKGKALAQRVAQNTKDIANSSKVKGTKAVFLMAASERGLMAAGSNTTPQLIFNLLGIENPFANLSGFKNISSESLAASRPDLILIASHTSKGQDIATLCRSPQLTLWAKEVGCNLERVDSLKFLGLTPRLPQALSDTHSLMLRHAN